MARNAKLTIILAAMWAAFMLLPAIVSPAAAHSGHHHPTRPVSGVSPLNAAWSVTKPTREDAVPSEREADRIQGTTWFSATAAQPHQGCHEGNCHCGCVLCHGGLLTAKPPSGVLDKGREKFELRVGVVLAKNLVDAIERPPRAAIPL
jgi:hypothetical protein